MGALHEEWRILGLECLKKNELKIAKKCFTKIQDLKFLDLIDRAEKSKSEHHNDLDHLVPEVLSLQAH